MMMVLLLAMVISHELAMRSALAGRPGGVELAPLKDTRMPSLQAQTTALELHVRFANGPKRPAAHHRGPK